MIHVLIARLLACLLVCLFICLFVCNLLKIDIQLPSCPAYGVVFPSQWPLQWSATRWHNLVISLHSSTQFGFTFVPHTTKVYLGHGIYCVALNFLTRIFVFRLQFKRIIIKQIRTSASCQKLSKIQGLPFFNWIKNTNLKMVQSCSVCKTFE